MNHSRNVFLNLIGVVLLCVTANITSAQEEGNSRTYKSSYDSVWKATVQSLVEGGDSIQSQNKETGTISTEWFVLNEPVVWTRGWRVRENILIEKVSNDETKVTLHLLFENKLRHGEWRKASNENDYTKPLESAFFENINKRLGK